MQGKEEGDAMSMEPLDFLQSISGYLQANQPGTSTTKIRIGTIDPAYVASSYPGTLPKITFDGEETMSEKTYAVISSYAPAPSDRVVLLPIGATYLILGALDQDGSGYFGGNLTVGDDITLASGSVATWAGDTNLYRSAANILKTDNSLEVAQDLTVGDDITLASGSVLTWATDTNLYRSAANTLRTDDSLVVGGGLDVTGTANIDSFDLSVGATSASAPVRLTTTSTASGNRALRTRGSGDSQDRWWVDFDGSMQWGPGGASGGDTNLYRSAANTLKTDDNLEVSGTINAGGIVYHVAYSGTTDASGFLTVTHGAPWTPVAGWFITTNPGASFAQAWGIDNIGATTCRLRFTATNTTGVLASTAVSGRLFLVK